MAGYCHLPPGSTAREISGQLDDRELVDLLLQAEESRYSNASFTTDGPSFARLLARVSLFAAVFLTPAALEANSLEEANKAFKSGEFGKASRAYKELIRENPGSADLYTNLGNAYFKAEETGKARAAYR